MNLPSCPTRKSWQLPLHSQKIWYPGPNHPIYSSNSTTTSYITSTHHPESIYNVQRCPSIRRNLHCSFILATTCPTPSHPIQINISPVKNFTSKFTHHPSWTTNSMYCLIHWLGRQDAMRLHGTKKVLIPSWLWIVVWLHPQTQMGFYDYPEETFKSEDEQPQDPNQLWTQMIYCYKGTSSHVTYAEIVSKHPQDTKDPLAFPSYHQKHACLH